MNFQASTDWVLKDVLVPLTMLAQPTEIGGARHQDCLFGDLVIRDGKVAALTAGDGQGKARHLVMPKMTECHVHLDKCHTISRMEGIGGDLMAAIEAQGADREGWTTEDVHQRAGRGLKELVEAGCKTVRTHVDWTHGPEAVKPPLAWHVLRELAEEFRGRAELQIAPLIGIETFTDLSVAEVVAKQVKPVSPVLGAFVFDQPDRQSGIKGAFEVAEKHGFILDFHVDEGLAEGLDGLELIADVALETGFEGPILCGHACSLMNLAGDDLSRLIEKIERVDMTIAALPTTNLYLQGRVSGTPDRRGVTRLRELRDAGVPVAAGTDNVRDAFCPLGRHDPRHSLALSVLAAHLDPPFGDYLPMITTNAERALGLAPTYVDGAAIGDLLLFDATSTSDLLGGAGSPRELSEVLKGELT